MFKEEYQKLNQQILPDKALVEKVKRFENKKHTNHLKQIVLKPVIACMIVIITFCSIPVLAANVESIYHLMYLVSPSVAQYFMPVQQACQNQGIKMEVVSAYINGNEAQIYITMQDLTGDRIDETMDLNDSFSINRAFACTVGNCKRVGYDEKTKTATFMITITNLENKKIDGEKLTFTVKNFISHKKEWNKIKLPITFEELNLNKETMKVGITGFASAEEKYKNIGIFDIDNRVLVPNREVDFGVKDMKLTGASYIDNKLHVQVAVRNALRTNNHGEIYLINNQTNEMVKPNYKLQFILWENGKKIENFTNEYETLNENRIDCLEYVFDISKEKLKEYSIYGDFIAADNYTEGKWQVTFPLESK